METIAYALLGKFFAWIGSIALVAWGAFKFLPERWLQHRFDRELEKQRADHARDLQDARHRLDVSLRRTSKLHEKEFEVLADAWEKLNLALGHVARLVAALQSYPDLDRMDDPRVEAFVAGSVLEPIDRQELLSTPRGRRNKYYTDRIFWYRLRDAKQACAEFHRAIQRNSIFLEPTIRNLFRKIDDAAWAALTSREIGEEAQDHKLWTESGTRLKEEIIPLRDEIEVQVQKRLGYEE